MNSAAILSTVALGALLAWGAAPASGRQPSASPLNSKLLSGTDAGQGGGSSAQPPQNDAKQDMKSAGKKTVGAAKDAGRGIKKGTKHAYRSTKHGTEKAARKTKNTAKGAVNGGKAGAKKPTGPLP